MVPHNLQFFWSDSDSPDVQWPPIARSTPFAVSCGYGEQAAPEGVDHTAFNYTYILPQYLQAVNVFLSIGAVIDPKFVQNWSDTIRSMACLMQSVHDCIVKNGITQLSPPFWTGQTLRLWTEGFTNTSAPAPTGTVSGVFGSGRQNGVLPAPYAFQIEFGAVERFSGQSSVGIYQLDTPPFDDESTDPRPYNKFQIRLLRRWKRVYIAAGLPTVWTIINSLKQLVGDPLLPRPNLSDWSIREIAAIITALPPGVPTPGLPISVVAVARILQNTLPSDTPAPPSGPLGGNYISLRSLLEPPL
jgi:hypothetical protein